MSRNAGFAQRLRLVKDEKDVTLREIAGATGVSEAAAAKWTAGGGISTDKLGKLSSFLKVNPTWLMFGDPGSAGNYCSADVQFKLGGGSIEVTPAALPPAQPCTVQPVATGWLAAGLAEELNRVLDRFRAETGHDVAAVGIENGRVKVELRR